MNLKTLVKNLRVLGERSFGIQKYPTAHRNAHLLRLLANGSAYFLKRDGSARPPVSVFVHVNNHCNLKCSFCDYGLQNRDSMFFQNLAGGHAANMPLDDFRRIVDEVKGFRPFISIPATEPLLYGPLPDAIAYVRENGLYCSINTNAVTLEKRAEALVEAGLTKIVVSVDGPRMVHDRIRGVPGVFDKVVAGLNRLAEVKRAKGVDHPDVYINYVIGDQNWTTLEDCVAALPMDAVRQVDFRVMFYCTAELAARHNRVFGDRYHATLACLGEDTDLASIDTDRLWDQVQRVTASHGGKCKFFFRHGRKDLHTYFNEPETFLDDTRCVVAWFAMQISTDGNLAPLQRCYHNSFGNIFERGFEGCWNGPEYRAFRRDLQKNGRFIACARCEGVNF